MEFTGLSRRTSHIFLACFISLTLVGFSGGNIKNVGGIIKWDELPQKPTYNTSVEEPNLTYDIIFVIASDFIHAVAPDEFPWDLLRGIIRGTVDSFSDYTAVLKYSAGFITCLVIGLLFVVAVPVTGIIFCCCRCCENCGGKMLQRDKYNSTCRRVTFGVVLLLVTSLMVMGVSGVFMANSQMSSAVQNVEETVDTNLDDIGTYIGQTFKEFHFLAFNQFAYVSGLILGDLFNIDNLVGRPVRNYLEVKVNPALQSVFRLAEDTQRLQDNLAAVNQSVNELAEKGATLTNLLTQTRSDINATLQGITCDPSAPSAPCPKDDVKLEKVATGADFSIIDIESELDRVNKALKTSISDLARRAQKEYNNIPEMVKNESKTSVSDFVDELGKLNDTVRDEADKIEIQLGPEIDKFLSLFSKNSGTPESKQLYDVLAEMRKYDRYRFYGGVGLCCVILIIILCNIIGMLFGECGRERRDRPTERSCVSNFGGTLLLTGVAFSFIFSAIIMLVTTLIFILGGLSQKVICEPVTTKTIFKEVIDYPYLFDKTSEYWLSDNIFGKGSDPLTVENLIRSCESNSGLYNALKLNNIFNITALKDYKKQYPGIKDYLTTINIDLSKVVLLDEDTKNALRDFVKSGVADVNYTQYLDEIRKGITQVNLTSIALDLESYAVSPLTGEEQRKLRVHAFKLRDIQTNNVAPMEAYVNSLETNLEALLSKAETLGPLVNETLTNVQAAQDYIQMEGPEIFKTELEMYVSRILNYTDSYALYVLDKVNKEVGGCKPLANLYDSLEILICKNLVYSFNGFWLCLGWCVFLFVPSIIFAVKLSKFYRRMRFYEDYYNAKNLLGGDNHCDIVRLQSMSRYGDGSNEGLRIGSDNGAVVNGDAKDLSKSNFSNYHGSVDKDSIYTELPEPQS